MSTDMLRRLTNCRVIIIIIIIIIKEEEETYFGHVIEPVDFSPPASWTDFKPAL